MHPSHGTQSAPAPRHPQCTPLMATASLLSERASPANKDIIVRSLFRTKHHVVVQCMARWMKCPLPPPPPPNPPPQLDPPQTRQGGQGRIDDITGKGLRTAVALSTASCLWCRHKYRAPKVWACGQSLLGQDPPHPRHTAPGPAPAAPEICACSPRRLLAQTDANWQPGMNGL